MAEATILHTYAIFPFLSDPFHILIVIVFSVGFTLEGCIVGGGGVPKEKIIIECMWIEGLGIFKIPLIPFFLRIKGTRK